MIIFSRREYVETFLVNLGSSGIAWNDLEYSLRDYFRMRTVDKLMPESQQLDLLNKNKVFYDRYELERNVLKKQERHQVCLRSKKPLQVKLNPINYDKLFFPSET